MGPSWELVAVPRSEPQEVTHPEQTLVSRWRSNPWPLGEVQEWECSPPPREPHLSEERPVEGDSEGTIHGPHGDVQIHQEPLLLLAVHRGSDPLEHTGGQGCLPQGLDHAWTPPAPLCHPFVTTFVTSPAQHPRQEHPGVFPALVALVFPANTTLHARGKRKKWLGRGGRSRKSNSRLVESWDLWSPVEICDISRFWMNTEGSSPAPEPLGSPWLWKRGISRIPGRDELDVKCLETLSCQHHSRADTDPTTSSRILGQSPSRSVMGQN